MVISTTFFIIAALIVAVWVVIEIKRLRHKIFAIFLICLILFAYVSATLVFKGQNIDFKSISGLEKASVLYFSWLGSAFGNLKSITTNAIHMNWGLNESVKNKNSS